MGRSRHSDRWLREHRNDHYVQKSRREGYRSRASYKLLEIDEKDALLGRGQTVVDLGAAPGGWSQVVAEKVGDRGLVVASDLLVMEPIPGVRFIQGDFTEQPVLDALLHEIGDRPVDVVISDMSPNISGVAAVDIPGAMSLIELALDMAQRVLRPEGSFVTKVFQGKGFDQLLNMMKSDFRRVATRKPGASRARSREQYQVCSGFRGRQRV